MLCRIANLLIHDSLTNLEGFSFNIPLLELYFSMRELSLQEILSKKLLNFVFR